MIACLVKGKSSGLRLSASFIWQQGFAAVNAHNDHWMNILNEHKMYALMHFWVRTNCICILFPWPTKRWRSYITGNKTVRILIYSEFTWTAPNHSSLEKMATRKKTVVESPALSVSLELIWAGDEASGLACEQVWHERRRNLETWRLTCQFQTNLEEQQVLFHCRLDP